MTSKLFSVASLLLAVSAVACGGDSFEEGSSVVGPGGQGGNAGAQGAGKGGSAGAQGGKAGAGGGSSGSSGQTGAGKGGAAGKAGAGGKGGSAGAAGAAGKGGSAGAAGKGGVGGAAGKGGAGGAGAGGAGSGGAGAGGAGASAGGAAGAGGEASGAGGDGGSSSAGAAGVGAGGGGEGGAGAGGAGQGGGGGMSLGTLGEPCEPPGKLACNGHAQPTTLLCGPGGVWISNGICPAGQLCESSGSDAGTCQPVAAGCQGKQPGEVVCAGADRIECGIDLTTRTKETCSSAAHCQQGVGSACAKCLDGEFLCSGVTLRECVDNLSFKAVKDCASAAQCNAGAGSCTDTVCVEGQHRCDGDLLQSCKADKSGFENKESCGAGLCDALHDQCDKCVAGEQLCKDGQTQLLCSADGQSLSEATCPAEKPFCEGGSCVACKAASDCPASANECQEPTCIQGACALSPVAKGKPVATQVTGDCQKVSCDGNGGQLSEADDGDTPADDNNPCTDQVCKSGVPDYPPIAKGTACAGGEVCDGQGTCGTCSQGDKRCAGDQPQTCNDKKQFVNDPACGGGAPYCSGGVCVECLADNQCPAPAECQLAVCSGGKCGAAGKAPGTPLASQIAGDCKTAVCDGNGGTTTQPNAGDLPPPAGECVTAACANDGTPSFPPKSAGAPCNGGAGVCNGAGKCGVCKPGATQCSVDGVQTCGADGQWGAPVACAGGTPYCSNGACVQCTQVSHCDAAGECRNAACNAGSCVYINKADGTAAVTQVPNDCKKSVCVSGAVVSQNDGSDLPVDDGKECTDQSCNNGSPSTSNKPAGTPCAGGKVCDGQGTCGSCIPGEKRCNGNGVPELCSGGGQWAAQPACAGGKPYCAAGACVACTKAEQCSVANECQTPLCGVDGTCGLSFKANGTPTSSQAAGDCKKSVCDGAGNIVSINDDTDVPTSKITCITQSCSNGSIVSGNAPAGTPCNGGAGVCSGAGVCGFCVPTSKRCNGNGPEICNASGFWTINGSCGGNTPYCSNGACVQCTQNSQCNANPSCQTGTCGNNTCTYADKNIAQTCGDGVKCAFEACDDGDKTPCGSCNAACNGPGNGLSPVVCSNSCADGGAEDIFTSTLVGCSGAKSFASRGASCGAGREPAPADAWTTWSTKAPANNYWTADNLKWSGSGSNNCAVSTSSGLSCGGSSMLVCSPNQPDSAGTTCNWTGCDPGAVDPGTTSYFGGCNDKDAAGTLCWQNPCADKTVEQIFPGGMAGCGGKVPFASRDSLCGAGYHVCSVHEYMSRRGSAVPSRAYWTHSELKFSGTTPADCFVDDKSGASCTTVPGGSSMKVCPDGAPNFPNSPNFTDPDGNTCTWTTCGFRSHSPDLYFGGCGNDSAGALCCADSPCADGSVEQVFPNGMVGCAGKVAFADRASLCGVGYRVVSSAEWEQNFGGIVPNYHYWTSNADLAYATPGSDGACSVGTLASYPNYNQCVPAKGPMHVCSPKNPAGSHPDPLGNQCNWVNCGAGASSPSAHYGGCSDTGTAGALCISDAL